MALPPSFDFASRKGICEQKTASLRQEAALDNYLRKICNRSDRSFYRLACRVSRRLETVNAERWGGFTYLSTSRLNTIRASRGLLNLYRGAEGIQPDR